MQGFAQLSAAQADAKIASSTQFWQSPLVYDANLDTIVDTQRIFTPRNWAAWARSRPRSASARSTWPSACAAWPSATASTGT
ncbi:hypothetical protein [Pseudoxanthomonas suwonensis]